MISKNGNRRPILLFFLMIILPAFAYPFTVVIDAGHGGNEKGAVQAAIVEKELTLRFAQKVRTQLEKRGGVKVVMTREDDSTVPIEERAKKIAEVKADLFISLHFNIDVFRLAETRGIELYYPADDFTQDPAAAFALYHRNNRSFALGKLIRDRYFKSDLFTVWKHDFNMFAQRDLKLFRLTDTPGLLIEVGYLTAPEDRSRIENEQFLDEMARFLAAAISEYAGKK